MLTDQDRAEIRQMIQQELNARGLANVATAGSPIPMDNFASVIAFPNPNPQKVLYPGGPPVTVTVIPLAPDIPTVSPDY